MKSIQDTPWVLMFDESLNKVTQQKQLDLWVRYWNAKESKYWTSEFMGHATANDLLAVISPAIQKLLMPNLLQLSMDGPAVNWKFYDLFNTAVKENHHIKLINSCETSFLFC